MKKKKKAPDFDKLFKIETLINFGFYALKKEKNIIIDSTNEQYKHTSSQTVLLTTTRLFL